MNFINLPVLVKWIKLREEARLKKEQGAPRPWTTDVAINNFRFCNVRREDDKVTKWIAANWRYGQGNRLAFPAAMTLARLFNEPSTLRIIGDPYHWDVPLMKDRVKNIKGRVFNPAYIVSTCGIPMNKVDYVFDLADQVYHRVALPTKGDSLITYYSRLTRLKGLGSGFLAGQIIADMKHAKDCDLYNADDWMTWCSPGPGSVKGLNYLVGIELNSRWDPEIFRKIVCELAVVISPKIEVLLSAQDMQNCLCELFKYQRVMTGGRSKQRYP